MWIAPCIKLFGVERAHKAGELYPRNIMFWIELNRRCKKMGEPIKASTTMVKEPMEPMEPTQDQVVVDGMRQQDQERVTTSTNIRPVDKQSSVQADEFITEPKRRTRKKSTT